MPFTDQLRLAAAAYLARFMGSSRAHTEPDLRSFLAGCGSAFGIAIAAAVFATAGGYNSAAAFKRGLAPAIAAAVGLALAGALAGLALPGRPGQAQDAPTGRVATVTQARTADAVAAGR